MMQKRWKLAMGCIAMVAILATNVRAQDEIASNVVGYVKVALQGGVISLLAQPFDQVDGSANVITNVLGDQAPAGTTVYVWDAGASDYAAASKTLFGWSADLPLDRGMGFWLKTDGDAEILLMGQVPEADTVAGVTTGWSLLGNPVPAEMLITDSGLNAAAAGTALYFWNGTDYVTYSKSLFGWPGDAAMGLGEGFWINSAGDFQWTEPAP